MQLIRISGRALVLPIDRQFSRKTDKAAFKLAVDLMGRAPCTLQEIHSHIMESASHTCEHECNDIKAARAFISALHSGYKHTVRDLRTAGEYEKTTIEYAKSMIMSAAHQSCAKISTIFAAYTTGFDCAVHAYSYAITSDYLFSQAPLEDIGDSTTCAGDISIAAWFNGIHDETPSLIAYEFSPGLWVSKYLQISKEG